MGSKVCCRPYNSPTERIAKLLLRYLFGLVHIVSGRELDELTDEPINGSDGWMWSKQWKPHAEIDGWNNVDERTKRHPLAPISNWRRNVWHLTLSSQARPQNVMVMIRQRAESMHFGIWNPVDYCELWIVDVAINAGEAETDNWSCRLIEKRGWSRFYKFSLHLFSVALLLGGQ